MKDSSIAVSGLTEEIASLKRRINELEQSESEGREALRKSERRFSEVTETTGDVYFETDAEGFITRASPSLYPLTGWRPEELLGTPASQIYVNPHDRERLLRGLSKSGVVRDYEVMLKAKDGRQGYTSLSAKLITDDKGRPVGMSGLIRDIRERKKADDARKAQFLFLQHLIDTIPSPVFYKDIRGLYRGCNRAFEEYAGLPREEILGRTVFEVHPKDVAETFFRRDGDLFESPGTQTYEAVIRRPSGVTRNIIISKATYNDATGNVAGLIGVMTDITDRKDTEERLRESEEKYRRLFDDAVLGVFRSTVDGRIITNNPAHARMFGYDSPEDLRAAVTDVARDLYADPSFRPRIIRTIEETGGPVQIENLYKRRDGSTFFGRLHIWAAPKSNEEQILEGFVEDITERHTAAEKLKESEEKYRSIFENAVEGMFQSAPEGRFLSVNPAMAKMCGYSSPEEMSECITDIAAQHYMVPEDRIRCRQILEDEGRMEKFEHQVRRKDGAPLWVSTNARTVRDKSGRAVYYEGTMEDITFRKEAEEALRMSEGNLRTILDSVNDGIVIHTHDGKIIDVNEKMLDMFGVTREEALSMSIDKDFSDPDGDLKSLAGIWEGVSRGDERIFEWGARRPRDGSIFYVEVFLRKIMLNHRDVILATIRDITDRRRAEEEKVLLEAQLRQSQKMEAIGTLAGGVAHDFNNILTTIIGYASLLQMDMYNDDPRKAYMDHILNASQKAANLTQGLLAFSRKQPVDLKPCKLNEVVKGVGKLLKRLLTEDIDFTITLAGKEITLMSDVSQIDQLLMNLATNGRDAMPLGGRLTIETKEVYLDREFVQLHGHGEEGRYALISVADTGVGMDKETKEKIFEPFFTTKGVGRGTGLGLSIVYGIVSRHNGYIDVASEPGKGTAFNIYIPAMEAKAEGVKEAPKETKGGNESILVAEDNGPLRGLVVELLTRAGYTVIEAEDGEEALTVFEKHKEVINLMILDVVMPKKNGKEVYEEIKKTHSHMKFLFTSGYTKDIILDKGIEDSVVDFIRKPLSPGELLLKVREVLDRQKERATRPVPPRPAVSN